MDRTTEGPDDLLGILHLLALARKEEEAARTAVQAARKEWEREHEDMLELAAWTADTLKLVEAKARALALSAFQDTGDTKPAPGVDIKLFKVALYEKDTALEWARQSGVALKLDEKAFDKLVLSGGLPAGLARVDTEPRVQIASDLASKLTPAPTTTEEG